MIAHLDQDLCRSLGLEVELQPGRRDAVRLPRGVYQALRAPAKASLSEWAAKHFRIATGSRPGPWRRDTVPYMPGMLDAVGTRCVREVDLCMSPQTGKSTLNEIVAAYYIDQDPSPIQWVQPDEIAARDVVKDRVRPMLHANPFLSKYLTGRRQDIEGLRIELAHMTLYVDYAGSASRLAAKSIKVQLRDEVDKFRSMAGTGEAESLDLADKRLRTFSHSYKAITSSTPTLPSGPIWQRLKSAPHRFYFAARCPICGHYQRLMFWDDDGRPCVCWPDEERDPDRIEDDMLAWYECELCKGHWDDFQRDAAVRHGEWRDEKTGRSLEAVLEDDRPRRIAFHLSALYSPFVSLSAAAAKFLRALGNKRKLHDFWNDILCLPWEDYGTSREIEAVLALRDDRPAGLVPGSKERPLVAALTAGVDTQDNGWWYSIRAWGWGENRVSTSWRIKGGWVTTWEDLEEVLFGSSYTDASGQQYHIMRGCIDAMGHKTSEVYNWCRFHPIMLPTQGKRSMTMPHRTSRIETYPGSTKPIPGGIELLQFDTTYYKDTLSGKMQVFPDDPGAFLFEQDFNAEQARHYTSEFRDDHGVWQCPSGKPNHLWDCSVLELLAAEFARVRFWLRPEERRPARKQKINTNPNGGHVPYAR